MSAVGDGIKSTLGIFDDKSSGRNDAKGAIRKTFQQPDARSLLDSLAQLFGGTQPGEGDQQELLDLLIGTGKSLTETTPESRFEDNFAQIQKTIQPQLQQLEQQLSQDFGARGLTGSPVGAGVVAGARGNALSTSISEALSRSFDESLKSKELGVSTTQGALSSLFQPTLGFGELLTRLISSLTSSKNQASASVFNTSAGVQGQLLNTGLQGSIDKVNSL